MHAHTCCLNADARAHSLNSSQVTEMCVCVYVCVCVSQVPLMTWRRQPRRSSRSVHKHAHYTHTHIHTHAHVHTQASEQPLSLLMVGPCPDTHLHDAMPWFVHNVQ